MHIDLTHATHANYAWIFLKKMNQISLATTLAKQTRPVIKDESASRFKRCWRALMSSEGLHNYEFATKPKRLCH
jgi:hypothetical protein